MGGIPGVASLCAEREGLAMADFGPWCSFEARPYIILRFGSKNFA
jgi:hypothetical protein